MGNPRSTFAKNERDRNKKARAAAKREKRLEKPEEGDLDDAALEAATRPGSTEPQDAIIEKLRILHQNYEEKMINDEDFENAKADLLAKLAID